MPRLIISMSRFAIVFAFLGVLVGFQAFVNPNVSTACPFCSAPSLTLTEQIAQADAAVIAHWSSSRPGKKEDLGTTDFLVQEVLALSKAARVKPGDTLTLVRAVPGESTNRYVIFGTMNSGQLDWSTPLKIDEDGYGYLKDAPKPGVPTRERLTYFMNYLEHPSVTIADDAYAEFANAPYDEITPLAPVMPKERIRKWLVSSDIAPSRLGLYGLMLGLSGDESDRELIESKIFDESEDFRLGIDGIMGGYLLLTGETGLAKLEERKLANRKAPFSETYAAMQALRFMWQYGTDVISQDRLRAAMRILLERPELADLVIADLARWKDWSVVDRLGALYDDAEFNIPSIKRAIVRYMIVAAKAGTVAASSAPPAAGDTPSAEPVVIADSDLPEFAVAAKARLAEIEKKDPKTVQDAKRYLFLK